MEKMIEKQYVGADGVTYTLYKPQQTPAWAYEPTATVIGDAIGTGCYMAGSLPSLDDYDGNGDHF